MESYLDFVGLPAPADSLGDNVMIRGIRRLFGEESPETPCVATCLEVDELEFCTVCG
jgi:hypothetical protein